MIQSYVNNNVSMLTCSARVDQHGDSAVDEGRDAGDPGGQRRGHQRVLCEAQGRPQQVAEQGQAAAATERQGHCSAPFHHHTNTPQPSDPSHAQR